MSTADVLCSSSAYQIPQLSGTAPSAPSRKLSSSAVTSHPVIVSACNVTCTAKQVNHVLQHSESLAVT